MFIKEVHLSSHSWHYKLQKLFFGQVPYKNNFCPYFWLTIFCIIFAPIYLPIKGFFLLIVFLARNVAKILDYCADGLDNLICNTQMQNISEENFYLLYDEYKIKSQYDYPSTKEKKILSKLNKKLSLFKLYLTLNKKVENVDDYISKLYERGYHAWLKKRDERLEKKQKIEEQRRKINSNVYPKIISFTKYFFTCLFIVFLIVSIFYSFVFCFWFIPIFSHFMAPVFGFSFWINILNFIKICCPIIRIIILLGTGLLIIGYIWSHTWCFLEKRITQNCVFCQSIRQIFIWLGQKITLVSIFIGLKIWSFLKSINKGIVLFFETIKIFKAKNCPPIYWKD
jgi:hypothetical protein